MNTRKEYTELSPEAQAIALKTVREAVVSNQLDGADVDCFQEPVFTDATQCFKCMGVELVDLGSAIPSSHTLSIFSIGFESYDYKPSTIREHAPKDTKLHEADMQLNALVVACRLEGIDVSCEYSSSNRHAHSSVLPYDDDLYDMWTGAAKLLHDWAVEQFQSAYDYLHTNEAIIEQIEDNPRYKFDIEGNYLP